MSRRHNLEKMRKEQRKLEKEAELDALLPENAVPEGRATDEIATDSVRIRGGNRTFTLVLFAMITLSLLIVMMLGINIYLNIDKGREASAQVRAETSLISSSTRLLDTKDALSIGKGPEGQSLVLTEYVGDQAYETRLYLSEGKIVQEYAPAGDVYSAERATEVTESKIFEVSRKGNLLTVTTDAGETHINLRSSQSAGGEQ